MDQQKSRIDSARIKFIEIAEATLAMGLGFALAMPVLIVLIGIRIVMAKVWPSLNHGFGDVDFVLWGFFAGAFCGIISPKFARTGVVLGVILYGAFCLIFPPASITFVRILHTISAFAPILIAALVGASIGRQPRVRDRLEAWRVKFAKKQSASTA